MNKEASSERKREQKRKADDERKQKDKEQLSDRLTQYTENNKATSFTNLGIQQGLVNTKLVNQPPGNMLLVPVLLPTSLPVVQQEQLLLDMVTIQKLIEATINSTNKAS